MLVSGSCSRGESWEVLFLQLFLRRKWLPVFFISYQKSMSIIFLLCDFQIDSISASAKLDVDGNQGRIKGGATGAIAPGPPLQGGPP